MEEVGKQYEATWESVLVSQISVFLKEVSPDSTTIAACIQDNPGSYLFTVPFDLSGYYEIFATDPSLPTTTRHHIVKIASPSGSSPSLTIIEPLADSVWVAGSEVVIRYLSTRSMQGKHPSAYIYILAS